MKNLYKKLLKQYANCLIEKQLESEDPSLDGGILCPACKVIHGRCIDAIYGFSVAYETFNDAKYLNAARKLLEYSANLTCLDGGIYNDLQTTWRYTTVFFVIDLAETLMLAKDSLPEDFAKELEAHLALHSKWLYENLDEHSFTNINYPINNALALYLAGDYFKNENYKKQGTHLAEYALTHITESSLLMGEGKPHDKISKRGCRAIDIGYNMEESLPALVKLAYYSKDEGMMKRLLPVCKAHLDFVLPDGAIDNSFSCRNYKWTYYGSRTCDGMIPMALILGKYEPAFLEASYRNLKLMEKCSPDGLLTGGPDYSSHHESPCVHHTFEHINSIAFAVACFNESYYLGDGGSIPSDGNYEKYYPELDSYRFGNDKFLFDVSCYDENILYSGHSSGATLSMLYSREKGPLIIGSVGDYELTEPTNMQVPLDIEHHRCLLPRFELRQHGKLYSSAYFTEAKRMDEKSLSFETGLMSRDGEKLPGSEFMYTYLMDGGRFVLRASSIGIDIPFILPLICGRVEIKKGRLLGKEKIFFLTPGFMVDEYRFASDEGEIEIEIS